jgi:hypothetical protein
MARHYESENFGTQKFSVNRDSHDIEFLCEKYPAQL